MNDKRYTYILYTIIIVIATTIVIQAYWNYKNYETNKQQLINDVQVSLDKAVDDYYAALAERTTIGFFLEGKEQKNVFEKGSKLDKFFSKLDTTINEFKGIDTIETNSIDGLTIVRGLKVDSMSKLHNDIHKPLSKDSFKTKVNNLKLNGKVDLSKIETLTSRVVVSINNDSLDLVEVDSLLKVELKRKNINITHGLKYYNSKNIFLMSDKLDEISISTDSIFSEKRNSPKDFSLSITSKSTFLPDDSVLKLNFSNETWQVLKRSLGGILISTLLVLAVISCLFYLLKIIKHQKQLAEVKNDLISNITHEFKTPIATIGVALESINNFNVIEDKKKTKKYVDMSSEQLGKLNIMVEKLLETATLDSDNLVLQKESINIVELLNSLIHRYKIQHPKKEFNTSLKVENLISNVDVFHFENAINNILDNAVKYGGHMISIDLAPKKETFNILISDNGNSLSKDNKERIFEKFYRVPKGNTHNVKGFGIGLYYTKTIIEKHNGTINLELNPNLTTFKITLPNG